MGIASIRFFTFDILCNKKKKRKKIKEKEKKRNKKLTAFFLAKK